MALFQAGNYLWVGAANTVKFYQQQTVTDTSKYLNLHMRQQIFQITAVDAAGRNLTLDKPLEYDLPLNSTSDGSARDRRHRLPEPGDAAATRSSGVGIEDLSFTQDMTGLPKLAGGPTTWPRPTPCTTTATWRPRTRCTASSSSGR